MKKLVVFDIAGTTIQDDNAVNKSFVEALNYFELSPTKEQVDKVMGLSKTLAIQILLDEVGNPKVIPVREIHDKFLESMIAYYQTDNNVKEIDGTCLIFEMLQERGFSVALNTGFSRDITNVILDKLGWQRDGLVNAVISSDQVVAGRPFPYMIFKLMEGLGIQRTRDVVKVGDTISDIQEGQNAGCGVVIGVLSGTCSRSDFGKCPGNFYIMHNNNHVPLLLDLMKKNESF